MYYDDSASQMLVCNGSNWTALGGGGGASSSGSVTYSPLGSSIGNGGTRTVTRSISLTQQSIVIMTGKYDWEGNNPSVTLKGTITIGTTTYATSTSGQSTYYVDPSYLFSETISGLAVLNAGNYTIDLTVLAPNGSGDLNDLTLRYVILNY
jgi:hypothetical protein